MSLKKGSFFNIENGIVLWILITYLSVIDKDIFNNYKSISLYVAILFIAFFIASRFRFEKKLLLIIVLSVSVFTISLLFTGGGFGSVLTFILPFFLLLSCTNLNFSLNQKKVIWVASFSIIVYEFYYSLRYADNYIYYNNVDINPNTIGMIIMYAMMFFLSIKPFSGKLYYIVLPIISMIGFLAMYNCRSRATTMATIIFLLLRVIRVKKLGKFLLGIAVFLTIIGTLFPYVYLKLYQNGVALEFFGKSLYTGREQIWLNMFDKLSENFGGYFIGLGSKATIWEGKELNIHNNFFNIIVNFGLFGYALYFYFLFTFIKKACKCSYNNENRAFLIMFITSVLLLGFTETTSFWNVTYVLSYCSLGIACTLNSEETCNE